MNFPHRKTKVFDSDYRSKSVFFVVLIISFCLQLKVSVVVYELIPGWNYIQFPWRLLALITPLAIIFTFMVLNSFVTSAKVQVCATVFVLFLFIAPSGALRTPEYSGFKPNPESLDGLYFSFSLFGEYYPKSMELPAPSLQDIITQSSLLGCELVVSGNQPKLRTRKFEVACLGTSRITLPITYSELNRFSIDPKNSVPRTNILVSNVNGLSEIEIPSGSHIVNVQTPKMSHLFAFFFESPIWKQK